MVHLSSGAAVIESYPFEELDRRKKEALDAGRRLIDLGVGDPREVTPEAIRRALIEAIEPVSSYPRAAGLPELREAICSWVQGRFGVRLDPGTQVLPTLGSKELIFSLAQMVADPRGPRDTVVVTAPGYTVPERGARYAGARVLRLPLTASTGFLPDLASLDGADWQRAAMLWLNYPNNPTGAVAPLGFLSRAAELAREYGFLLACDEAYSELWFGSSPPAGGLQVGDLGNVIVINTLSKRSSMTGYRSGFVAGDEALIAALKRLRPSAGVTPQEFVQRASIVAWSDESHVRANRDSYAAKRAALLPVFARSGVEVAASEATFYLWVKVPGERPSLEWALDLLDRGVVVAPGSFFGPEGEGCVRIALVPTLDDCVEAAEILDVFLKERGSP